MLVKKGRFFIHTQKEKREKEKDTKRTGMESLRKRELPRAVK
jgi:hypothetical protein